MKLSLKLRLTLLFLVLSLTAWFAASLVAWQQTTHKLDKLFDTQQMLFAKRLLTMELDELHAPARMREVPKKAKHGHLDDDALAFAIYASDGTMILNDGENGRDIPYHYRRDGFDDGRLQDDNDEWRFLWLTSPDGKYRVVVGQEWEYRQDMALDVVSSQLTPWLVALPVMLLLLIVLLSRELKPLKKLAQTLRARSPDATDALPTQGVPAEVRPLLDSLNHLFARTQEMMTRERRFTSDAAHELRSPLAALDVIDAAFVGSATADWPGVVARLGALSLLDEAQQSAVQRLWWFGRLIANSDIHAGNLSFEPDGQGGLRLAPAYDMLPMRHAPLPGGEVPTRAPEFNLPLPAQRTAWLEASVAALAFWREAAGDTRISDGFRETCSSHAAELERLQARA